MDFTAFGQRRAKLSVADIAAELILETPNSLIFQGNRIVLLSKHAPKHGTIP
jgi:hypothetical protein